MHYLEDLKEILEKELEKNVKELRTLSQKGTLSLPMIETAHKLTDTLKNVKKIEALCKESDDMSYGYSERRRRDSMGRYTSYGDYGREDADMRNISGTFERGYSEDRGSSYRGMGSYHGAKDHLMSQLGEMMEGADPKTRETLKRCMRELED